MALDQEGAEETVGSKLKDYACESGPFSDFYRYASRHEAASAGLSKGGFCGHQLYTHTPLRRLLRTCIKKVEMSLVTNIVATLRGFTIECPAPL